MSAPKVYDAINRVTTIMASEGIAKGRKNQQQGYTFRGIDDVYAALSRVLAEEKLCILPRVMSSSVTERETQRGGVLFYTRLEVEFDFVSSEDGSSHTIRTVGEAMDSADKSSNKAMSAAYKYACFMTFCIPVEGDNDADATTHEVAANGAKGRGRGKTPTEPPAVTPGQIKELTALLTAAAKEGTFYFRNVWRENDGPVRAAVAADSEIMERLQAECAKADAKQRPADAPDGIDDDGGEAAHQQQQEQQQQEGA